MSIIRGVYGKYLWSENVWVTQAVIRAKVCAKIDLMLKAGIPSTPKLLLEPRAAYCVPKPTSNPATISLNADVFWVYLGTSKGEKLVRCSWYKVFIKAEKNMKPLMRVSLRRDDYALIGEKILKVCLSMEPSM